MPKKLIDGNYACSYCGKVWKTALKADGCEKAHHLIYVPFPKEDLMALLQFMYTREMKLLEKHPKIMETLSKYARVRETEDDVSSVSE